MRTFVVIKHSLHVIEPTVGRARAVFRFFRDTRSQRSLIFTVTGSTKKRGEKKAVTEKKRSGDTVMTGESSGKTVVAKTGRVRDRRCRRIRVVRKRIVRKKGSRNKRIRRLRKRHLISRRLRKHRRSGKRRTGRSGGGRRRTGRRRQRRVKSPSSRTTRRGQRSGRRYGTRNPVSHPSVDGTTSITPGNPFALKFGP